MGVLVKGWVILFGVLEGGCGLVDGREKGC